MIKLPILDQADIANKKIFVRGDIDVPLKDGKIVDDTRLKGIWPTIEYLLKQNCQVILAGHLGRPEGKVVAELSSRPVAEWFRDKAGERVQVLENLRFDPREEANDEGYARQLAGLADVYVNESFAESHREVASIVGVPKFLPHFAGLRLAKEVEVLSAVLETPQRPLLVIIGGAKLETKLPVMAKMAERANIVVVGGKLLDEMQDASSGIRVRKLEVGSGGNDVTLESVDKIASLIAEAKTIVWNGPMGRIEEIPYQVGTKRLAEMIAGSSAYKIVGGGDTVGFINKLGLAEKFDWVSSGGGSMLKFLSGEKLPGVEVLLT